MRFARKQAQKLFSSYAIQKQVTCLNNPQPNQKPKEKKDLLGNLHENIKKKLLEKLFMRTKILAENKMDLTQLPS